MQVIIINQKIKLFEVSASDPRRLFRPSFQLIEEEKFRKTCYPNLFKLESKLIDSIKEYEKNENQEFNFNDERYMITLVPFFNKEAEIAHRFINDSVFLTKSSMSPKRKKGVALQNISNKMK